MTKRDYRNIQNLLALNPGQETETLLRKYRREKNKLLMMILLVGGLLVLVNLAAEGGCDEWLQDGVLRRPAKREEIVLNAYVSNESEQFREEMVLEVQERLLQRLELEDLFEALLEELEEIMWQENKSCREITGNLYLPENIKEYPFVLSWSSDSSLVDDYGIVHREDLEQPTEAVLRVEAFYGSDSFAHEWCMIVQPPERTKREEILFRLKRESEQAQQEQRYGENMSLPTEMDGYSVVWRRKRTNTSVWILVLTITTAILVYEFKDKDLQSEVVKRRECMRREYPLIVSKYALCLEAGLTVRGAFEKIARDYQKENGKKNPLCEEMTYACNELKAGISENKVYEHFGRRVGTPEYVRFCALLNQNLKKGNTALVKRLREESVQALRDELQMKKRHGEEAGTKLLLPMGMLLIMVLVMVVIPAFGDLV